MKNIKVSEVVYEKINSERKGGETFDDALRSLLGLSPQIDKVVAYLHNSIRDCGKEIIDIIDECGNFKKEIESGEYEDKLIFIDNETKLPIAEIHYRETNFSLYYRNRIGNMTQMAVVGTKESYELNKEEFTTKVQGAVRKWGST